MNVVFAVSDAGFGHRAAARAIDHALAERYGSAVRSDVVDVYQEMSVPVLRNSPDFYVRSSRRGRPALDLIYEVTDRQRARAAAVAAIDRVAGRRTLSLVEDLVPDLVVVCNPVYMGELFARARGRARRPFRVVTVVTDPVSVHQSWLSRDADLHFVVAGDGCARLPAEFPSQPIGFPVHPDYLAGGPDREQARLALGLAVDRPTVLLTGGGSGGGRAREWVRLLRTLAAHPRIQVLVAPGTNRALAAFLRRPEYRDVRVLPATGSLNLPMRAASAVLSKAGPATIFEAAAVGVPVLLFDEVGRQERGNIAYAERLGVGRALGSWNPTRLVTTLETRPRRPRPELADGAGAVADWIGASLRTGFPTG